MLEEKKSNVHSLPSDCGSAIPVTIFKNSFPINPEIIDMKGIMAILGDVAATKLSC